jgi:hypothetical protein
MEGFALSLASTVAFDGTRSSPHRPMALSTATATGQVLGGAWKAAVVARLDRTVRSSMMLNPGAQG